MRLLRLGTVSPAYWQSFYARHPELPEKSSDEQMRSLFYDSFAQSDSYCHYLNKLDYECKEVCANPVPLQKSWAKENGVTWLPQGFTEIIALETVKKFLPDIVFLNNFSIFNGSWVSQLKEACPSVRFVISWCAIPLRDCSVLTGCDLVLTSSIALREQYRQAGCRAELLRHAFDPRVLDRIGCSNPKIYPFSFVGSILRQPGMHNERAELVERLLQELEMTLFCKNTTHGTAGVFVRRSLFRAVMLLRRLGIEEQRIKKFPLLRKAADWPQKPRYPWHDPIARANRGDVFGLDMYRALAASYASLNVHIDATGEYTGNLRLFEGPGAGTCLLTDWKNDLGELFEIDREVVSYRSADECIEKARWLADHPRDCLTIGAAGQQRTLRSHTYACRAEELDAIIRKNLA